MLTHLRYYARRSAQILERGKNRPVSRPRLLMTYYSLVLKSFLQHRFGKSVASARPVANIFGYQIYYSSLPVLITLFEEIFIEGVYYFESTAPHPEILDGGSNVGMSVLYFKMLYPQSLITAFEPDLASLSLLEKNVLRNPWENVMVIDEALGREKSERFLYTPREGDPSLNQTLMPAGDTISSKKVKVNCLSSFITGPVDFVKLDIEGAELEVLEDLIETKKIDLVKCMVIEFHHRHNEKPVRDFIKIVEGAGLSVTVQKESVTESLLRCNKRS